MVFHEGAEEILASADHRVLAFIEQLNCLDVRERRGTFYLHAVLESEEGVVTGG